MSNAALKTEARGDALHLLAMVAYREGRHEDAIILYDRAISNGVNDPKMAEWNKSLALQSIGRYREGWAASESRFTQTTDPTMAKLEKRFQRPVWKGETNPMRVHLHHEMGFGDVIAMCRYIPLMHEMGHTLSIEVNDSLISLLKRSFPYVHVLPKALDYPGALGLPDFDMHVPMLSLPAIFKTDVDTVPWSGPYLKPPAHVVARDVRRPLVGLCWSSGIRHESLWLKEYGTRKSMSFETLWKGIGRCDATFVTLQIDQEVPSFVNLGDRLDAPSVLDLFKDDPTWDDTAAIVQNLDLVITVDTSIAHLAGALGKPTWVMMHTEGSWHWMTKRLDSPWYPTARLFRQERPHQWDGVVAQVASELSELSKQKAA
jgi:hypothetical protein